jgi:hypothetical protein
MYATPKVNLRALPTSADAAFDVQVLTQGFEHGLVQPLALAVASVLVVEVQPCLALVLLAQLSPAYTGATSIRQKAGIKNGRIRLRLFLMNSSKPLWCDQLSFFNIFYNTVHDTIQEVNYY